MTILDVINKKISKNDLISNQEVEDLINFFKYNNTSSKEQIIVMKQISRNNSLYFSSKEEIEFNDMNEYGYASFSEEDKEETEFIKSQTNYINQLIGKVNIEEILKYIPKFDDFNSDYYTFKSIMENIIRKVQSEIFEYQKLFLDKNYFSDKEIKKEIESSFEKSNKLLIELEKFYEEEENRYQNKINNEFEESLKSEKKEINKIIYLKTPDGKSLIQKDIKNIPGEYLKIVVIILNKMKYGECTLGREFKPLTGLKQKSELRDGSGLRIMLKNLGNNSYGILGAFVKKAQNSRLYDIIDKRQCEETISEEENHQLEQEIINYCVENVRGKNKQI